MEQFFPAPAPSSSEFNDAITKMEWKLIGGKMATGAINLPSDWRELLVQVISPGGQYLTSYFLRNMFASTTDVGVGFGTFGTSFATGKVNTATANLDQLNWAGTNVTASATTYYYYR